MTDTSKRPISDSQIHLLDVKERKAMELFCDTLLTALRREHPIALYHLQRKNPPTIMEREYDAD